MWYNNRNNNYYYTILKFMLYTDKCKNRKSVYLTLDKRNEQLKKKDQVIIDLKQKLKDKEQECGIILHNLTACFID